jgi:hypothetical protein
MGLGIKHRADDVDRQKLALIWSRFGLNNVLAGFHHIPVISRPRAGVVSAATADNFQEDQAGGWCGFEIVSRWLTRIATHGAPLASGDVIQIFPTKFAFVRIG